MLEKFRTAKMAEIELLAARDAQGLLSEPWQGVRTPFAEALKQNNGLPAIIAEYKRASPSKGSICETLDCEMAVKEYMENGASALSILTERKWFKGETGFLGKAHAASVNRQIPILRKDFLFHPLQIRETGASPASALLLIVRMIPDVAQLRALREDAEKYGIESVVEIFDMNDLALARESGAKIIQVNNRDLSTLKVNTAACGDIIRQAKPESHEKWIAASGFESNRQLREAAAAGYDAALIGSCLMAGGKPGETLRNLLKGA